jgi:hypothetical protein
MAAQRNDALASLVRSLTACLNEGNVDAAATPAKRRQLAALCQSPPPQSDQLTRLNGLTLAVELSLIAFDHATAASLLAPYLTKDQTALATNALLMLQRRQPIATAALLSAIADLLYRQRSYPAAYDAAERADVLFNRIGVSAKGLQLVITRRLWNLARWGRISWREGKPDEAQKHLRHCLQELDAARQYLTRHRADSVEAFALDVSAALDWAQGNLPQAQSNAYRALYLHSTGSCQRACVGRPLGWKATGR